MSPGLRFGRLLLAAQAPSPFLEQLGGSLTLSPWQRRVAAGAFLAPLLALPLWVSIAAHCCLCVAECPRWCCCCVAECFPVLPLWLRIALFRTKARQPGHLVSLGHPWRWSGPPFPALHTSPPHSAAVHPAARSLASGNT